MYNEPVTDTSDDRDMPSTGSATHDLGVRLVAETISAWVDDCQWGWIAYTSPRQLGLIQCASIDQSVPVT